MSNFHIINKVIKIRKEQYMRKERDITIKVIEGNKINYNRLADYFAKKYSEKIKNMHKNTSNEKS